MTRFFQLFFSVTFFISLAGFSQGHVRKKADDYNLRIEKEKKKVNDFVSASPFYKVNGSIPFSKAHAAAGIKIPYYNKKDSILWVALRGKLEALRKEILEATNDKAFAGNPEVKNYFANQYLLCCFSFAHTPGAEDRIYCLDRKCDDVINTLYAGNPSLSWAWGQLYAKANRGSYGLSEESVFDDDRYTYFFDDPEKDFFYENGMGYYYKEYSENYNSTYNDSTGEETIVREGLSNVMMGLENCLDSFSMEDYAGQLKLEERIHELAGLASQNKIANGDDFYYIAAIAKVLLNNHYPADAKKCLSRLCEYKSAHPKSKSLASDYYDLDYLLLTYSYTFVDSSLNKHISPEIKKMSEANTKPATDIKMNEGENSGSWFLPDSIAYVIQAAANRNYPKNKIVELIKKANVKLEEKRSKIMLRDYLDMKSELMSDLSDYGQYDEAKKCALQMKNVFSAWLKLAEFSDVSYGNTREQERDFRNSKVTFDLYKDLRKFISAYYPEKKAGNIFHLFKSDTVQAVYEERKKNEFTWMGYRFPVQMEDTAINLNDYFENFFSASNGKEDTCKLFFDGAWLNYFVLSEAFQKIGTYPFASDISRKAIANYAFTMYSAFEELGIEYELNDVVGFATRNIGELDKYKYAETMVEYAEFLRSSGFTSLADSLQNRCFRFYLTRGDSVSEYFGRLAGELSLAEEDGARKIYFARHCNRAYSSTGKNSNNLSRSYGILATAWLDMEKPDSAKPFIDKMLSFHRKVIFDTASIEYAQKITSLARYYKEKNNTDSAICFYAAAVKIYRDNSDTISNIEPFLQLAALYDKTGLKDKAYEIYSTAFNSISFILEKNFPYLSDDEKLNFFVSTKGQIDRVTNFYCNNRERYPELGKKLFEFSSSYKGSVVKTSAYLKKGIASVKDSRIKDVYRKYYELKEKQNGDSLENDIRIVMMERYLSQLVKELNGEEAKSKTNAASLSKALSPDEAIVNIVYYKSEEGENKPTGKYFAQIVKKDSEWPLYADLGKAVALEQKGFMQYRNEMAMSGQQNDPGNSYSLFFEPLVKHLAGIEKIYFCVDGVYNKINLNALYNPVSKKYLLEEFTVVQTTSAFDVAKLKSENPQKAYKRFVVVGDVKFSTCKKYHRHDPVINPLPGTLAEYKAVENRLRANYASWSRLTNKEAQEIFFKWQFSGSKDTCHLVHIATHGFYVPDKKEFVATLATQKEENIAFRSAMNFSVSSKNPFLRSGLLFSGSENTLNGEAITDTVWSNPLGRYTAKQNDGILTAYEIMDLNLNGTELVVLSACESGLGNIVNGVGVNGLQKAFKTAGAKKIMMSLWPVDDQATKEFMSDFYSNLFGSDSKTKNDINASMIVTMKKMKEKYKTPLLWAPFILVN